MILEGHIPKINCYFWLKIWCKKGVNIGMNLRVWYINEYSIFHFLLHLSSSKARKAYKEKMTDLTVKENLELTGFRKETKAKFSLFLTFAPRSCKLPECKGKMKINLDFISSTIFDEIWALPIVFPHIYAAVINVFIGVKYSMIFTIVTTCKYAIQ